MNDPVMNEPAIKEPLVKEPVIKIKDLHVSYGQTKALAGVNLTVFEKEFLGIIGPNGGGKTTLVKTVLGLLEQDKGSVEVREGEVVGYVPQLTAFDREFPITVEEVILTGHLPKKINFFKSFTSHEKEHADRVMKRLGISNLSKRQIGQLSGGQMQRVLIARALMNHPTILVLDEPTAGVDEVAKQDIYTMLTELNGEMTIMMITHDTSILLDYLDRVIYINKRAHAHDGDDLRLVEGECCPIDWFLQGEEIQRDLLKEDSSHD